MSITETIEAAVATSTDKASSLAGNFLRMGIYAAQFSDFLPPWWSPHRDAAIRQMVGEDGAYLAGLVGKAVDKLSTIPISVTAKDPTVQRHVDQAQALTATLVHGSGYGTGLMEVMSRFVGDILTQDNGGFIEVVAEGKKNSPVASAVLGLEALDAARCTRTGDPLFPVQYMDMNGRLTNYHFTRIFYFSQLPSNDKTMLGVGQCAVSRSVRVAMDLAWSLNAKAEKKGARPISRIITGKNISGEEIITTLVAAEEMMGAMGLTNYQRTVAIGGRDIELSMLEMKDLEGIDYGEELRTALYALAYIWGMEAIELFPVTGSRSSDQIALERARSMLPLWFIRRMKESQWKFLPPHLQLEIDHSDSAHDHQRAVISDIIARGSVRRISSKVSTPWAERVALVEAGHMDRGIHNQLSRQEGVLPSGMPVETVLLDARYSELVRIPPEMLEPASWTGETEVALAMIAANRTAALGVAANGGASAKADKALEVVAALDIVAKKYNAIEPAQAKVEVNEDTRRAAAPALIKQQQYTSTVVVLHIPDDVAQKLAVNIGSLRNPLPPDGYHVTLAYFSSMSDLEAEAMMDVLSGYEFSPVSGLVSGSGCFPKTDDGYPIFRFLDSQALPKLRGELLDLLSGAGFDTDSEHGFIPHVTIGYEESPAMLPDMEPVAVTFNNLTVLHKGTRIDIL